VYTTSKLLEQLHNTCLFQSEKMLLVCVASLHTKAVTE